MFLPARQSKPLPKSHHCKNDRIANGQTKKTHLSRNKKGFKIKSQANQLKSIQSKSWIPSFHLFLPTRQSKPRPQSHQCENDSRPTNVQTKQSHHINPGNKGFEIKSQAIQIKIKIEIKIKIKSHHITSSQIKSHQINSNPIKPNQNQNQIKIKSNQTEPITHKQ